MDSLNFISSPLLSTGFLTLVLWSIAWTGYALWKAARNSQHWWFLAMLLLNTAGILPIIYLVWFQRR